MAVIKIPDGKGGWIKFPTIKGDKGDQGIQGIQGPKGDKGDQGIQGEHGKIRKAYESLAEAFDDKNPVDPYVERLLEINDLIVVVNDEPNNGVYLIANIESDGSMILQFVGKIGDLEPYTTKEFAQFLEDRITELEERPTASPVIDSLDSFSTEYGLSANMGRLLNEEVEWLKENGGGGGGGTGPSTKFKVRSLTPTAFFKSEQDEVILEYEWSSLEEDGSDTGNGTLVLAVSGRTMSTDFIPQGVGRINVTKHLSAGTNNISVTISDSYGNRRIINYNISIVSLEISSPYNPATLNSSDITFRYTPIGDISKTIHFILDGEEIATRETIVSNRQLS